MTSTPAVLVTYASVQGSTATIANCIGDTLTAAGRSAVVASVTDDPDPGGFAAVVLGSAIHDGDYLPEFHHYIERHRADLSARPTWLFSVGMGPALRGPIGAVFRRMVPPAIASVRDMLGVTEFHAFAGVFDRPPQRRLRVIMRLMGARYGDNRDWGDVRAWAFSIAAHLR
ncbi:conserved hypothetical protein [Rhodococcus sp. RD6.2]|uniref:flavodoxin domain-containing protein n=1 Tax=Rhodococcus sp. RD6.2 TaxID=260936 RepID=UPI00063B2422|nr:flavodoxin domain-containing protein [Rhodococcus sp. RD6.2]CRK51205.1 conserved hypothetical protein [Rhodococcus sp. RD6.2]